MYYNLPTSALMQNSMMAAEAWIEAFDEADKQQERIRTYPLTTLNPQTNTLTLGQPSWEKGSTYDGYTLITLRYSEFAYLLDMEGRVLHHWHMPFLKAWPNPVHVHTFTDARTFISKAHVYPNGDLLAQFMGAGDTPYGYGMVRMDKDSNVLWTYSQNTHHDFHITHTGDIYTIIHGIEKASVPGPQRLFPLLVDSIVKLSPEGKELERIALLDAFKDTPFIEELAANTNGRNRKVWDYFHTNTVMMLEPSISSKFPMFNAGDILISMRTLDALAVIDGKTHKIKWFYKGPWQWPHAAKFLPNGHILVMDNLWRDEYGRPASRVLEFKPDTKEIVWQFPDKTASAMRSTIFGRLQRFPNGNTLIAETMSARVFEVTPDDRIVWSYQFTSRPDNAIVSAMRYQPNTLTFLEKAHAE